jgi:hypothetical protein
MKGHLKCSCFSKRKCLLFKGKVVYSKQFSSVIETFKKTSMGTLSRIPTGAGESRRVCKCVECLRNSTSHIRGAGHDCGHGRWVGKAVQGRR